MTALDGTWTPITAELNGKSLPSGTLASMSLVVDGDTYATTTEGIAAKGTLVVNESAVPKTMDIVGSAGPNRGKRILALFALTGNSLRVCYDLTGTKRPDRFQTAPESNLLLVLYKRHAKE